MNDLQLHIHTIHKRLKAFEPFVCELCSKEYKTVEKKLDYFDPSETEWVNMQNNGYDRIWDCGSLVYGWIK
jgi:hypothetical protein